MNTEASFPQRMFDSFSGIFGNTAHSPENMARVNNDWTAGARQNAGAPAHAKSMNIPEQDEEEEHDETSAREDLLDQHVAYYLKHHPEVHQRHKIQRVRPGVYNFNGREIMVEWSYAEEPGAQGCLVAIDGPLRQPFSDYVEDTENGVEYDDKRLGRSSLSQVAKGNRLSFGDGSKVYSRLEAMKVAKEQALVREKAAEFSKVGMDVPQHELMSKYNKTISQKLGERRQRPQAEPAPQAEAPVAAPVVAPPAPSLAPAAPSPQASRGKGKQTHGAPKYCPNHNKTEQRKKTKPQNLPCSICQTLIQTNYVEFALCPTCSEKEHRCMCCGAPAVGAAPSPQAQSGQNAPPSPMNPRSPQQGGKSPSAAAQQMSPMNLFGLPDLFQAGAGNAKAAPSAEAQGQGLFSGAVSAMQGLAAQNRPPSTVMMSPQNNAYASNNAFASNNVFASQNPMASKSPMNGGYAAQSQNAFASYNPVASQSPMASQGAPRRF